MISQSLTRGSRELIAVNDAGLPIGEGHHRAKLSDAEVDEMRDLREARWWSIPRLARKFSVSVSTVHAIVTYRSRAQCPTAWRRPPAKQRSQP
jgi:DNA-binding transcriptional regulator YiaG